MALLGCLAVHASEPVVDPVVPEAPGALAAPPDSILEPADRAGTQPKPHASRKTPPPKKLDPESGSVFLRTRCEKHALPAWLHITQPGDSAKGGIIAPILLSEDGELTIPTGQYIFEVEAGPRLWSWRQPVLVTGERLELEPQLTLFWTPRQLADWAAVELFPSRDRLPAAACNASDIRVVAAGPHDETVHGPIRLIRDVVTDPLYGRIVFLRDRASNVPASRKALPLLLTERSADMRIWELEDNQSGAGLVFATVAGPLYDALAVGSDEEFAIWQALCQQGYRISAVGRTRREVRQHANPDGYLPAASAGNAQDVLQALRRGRMLPSNGPLIVLRVDGLAGGVSVPASEDNKHTVVLEVISSTWPDDAISSIELLYNGEVLRSYPGKKDQRILRMETQMTFPRPGWLVARYVSTNPDVRAQSHLVTIATTAYRTPPPPLTEVTIQARQQDAAVACTVEAWNGTLFLGAYAVAADGAKLELPCTARLVARMHDGGPVAEAFLPEVSGAMQWVREYADVPDRRAFLENPATFESLRRKLSRAAVVFRFPK